MMVLFSWMIPILLLLIATMIAVQAQKQSIQLFTSNFTDTLAESERLQLEEVDRTIQEAVAFIRGTSVEDLLNVTYLEHVLIPNLGLNPEINHQYPPFLTNYTLKGIKTSQYPNQLAKFLIFLSTIKHNRYLEIGVRFGGTFLIIHEYLLAIGQPIEFSVGIDIEFTLQMGRYMVDYVPATSNYMLGAHPKYEDLPPFDVCFIDGDHSLPGVMADFETVKKHCVYVVFHDICYTKYIDGLQHFWKSMKYFHHPDNIWEFTDQYESVNSGIEGMSYLGFGIVKIR